MKKGLKGVALTDHGCISGHVEFIEAYNKIKEDNKDFRIALGEEVYVIEEIQDKKIFKHLVLLAKDKIGYQQLREISSMEWENHMTFNGVERVFVTKQQLFDKIKENPGHIIASTACIGGILGKDILQMREVANTDLLKRKIMKEIN